MFDNFVKFGQSSVHLVGLDSSIRITCKPIISRATIKLKVRPTYFFRDLRLKLRFSI